MPELPPPKELDALSEEMRKLRRAIEKLTSFKRTIFRSLVSGVATAIGATIVATVLILGLLKIAKSFGLSDWLVSSDLNAILKRMEAKENVQQKP